MAPRFVLVPHRCRGGSGAPATPFGLPGGIRAKTSELGAWVDRPITTITIIITVILIIITIMRK